MGVFRWGSSGGGSLSLGRKGVFKCRQKGSLSRRGL